MFEAYLDETDRNPGDFCVAGALYTRRQAKRLVRAWSQATGSRPFHAKDARRLKPPFDDFSKSDMDRLWGKLAAIVCEQRNFLIGIHCDLSELDKIRPPNIKLRKLAYAICAVGYVTEISKWLKNRSKLRVSYIFDQGHIGEGAANAIIERWIAGSARAKEKFRYRSHAFVDWRESEPLQASDFVAWEFGNATDKVLLQKRMPTRALQTLLGGKDKRNFIGCLSGDRLRYAVETYEIIWTNTFGRKG